MPKDFVWRGEEAKQRVLDAATAALRDAAEAILTESHKEVPHDTGTLQRSGTVTVGQEGGGPVAVVSYNTPYARRLHEHPEYRFAKGRKAKYLEDPFKRMAPRAIKFVRDRIKAALGRK